MCRGGRLIADFVAGTGARPGLPEDLDEHLTMTVDGRWVVWAHKLARPVGDLFVPLTGGAGYPADARAECRARRGRRGHRAPDPGCTCGFHALSSRRLPGLRPGRGCTALTVALSGRVLALAWAGEGVLWRAERQTVIRIERSAPSDRAAGVLWPAPSDRAAGALRPRRPPEDPGGRAAAVCPVPPRDGGPVRLHLPPCPAVLTVCHDDAGWCAVPSTVEHSQASLVMA